MSAIYDIKFGAIAFAYLIGFLVNEGFNQLTTNKSVEETNKYQIAVF
ncbi:hypothetical protein H6F77_03345 [Microcoleus sp. FACHB-831]|nr:hypothetical protein [Microcoleus sp. FACHB-831]MBD1920150.1 hypothetical protein [Microcoleus sp. FACHB-831]